MSSNPTSSGLPDPSMNLDASEDSEDSQADSGPQRSIARNIGALISSQVITWTLSTAVVVVVPRYLGSEAFGSLRVATSFWAIAVVLASFGTSTLMTVEIAKRRPTFRSLTTNVIRLRLVLYAIAVPIVAAILLVGPYDRATVEVAAIVGIGGLFTLLITTYESALYGLQEMGSTARIRVITKVVLTVATLSVVLLGGRLVAVAISSVAGIALTAFLFARVIRRMTGNLTAPSDLAGRTLMVASLPFLAAEATRVIYQQIDTVVMSFLVDSDAIGNYAAADTLFGSLLFVPVIVTTALFPAIADRHERAPSEVAPMLRRSFNTLLLVSLPIGLGTIVVAPSFIDLLLGEKFAGAAPVLAVYGVVVVLSSQSILLGRFALATGRAKFWSSLMIGVTILSVPLDIVLVPWTDRTFDNGAIGGALAYVVTESALIAIGLWKIGPTLLTRSTLSRVARCSIAGGAMIAAAWPLRDEMFILPGAVSVLVYVAVILLLRTLHDDELAVVRQGWARFPVKRNRRDTQ